MAEGADPGGAADELDARWLGALVASEVDWAAAGASEDEEAARPFPSLLREGGGLRLMSGRSSSQPRTKFGWDHRLAPDFLKSYALRARTQEAYWECRKYCGSTVVDNLSGLVTMMVAPSDPHCISSWPSFIILHVHLTNSATPLGSFAIERAQGAREEMSRF